MRLKTPLPPLADALVVAGLILCGVGTWFVFRVPPDSTTSEAAVQEQTTRAEAAIVARLGVHCAEAPLELHRLVYAHGDQLIYAPPRDTVLQPQYFNGLRAAMKTHDPRRPCAPLIDSVASSFAQSHKRQELPRR